MTRVVRVHVNVHVDVDVGVDVDVNVNGCYLLVAAMLLRANLASS